MSLQVLVVGYLDRLEAAHTGAHEYPDAIRIRLGHLESRIAHGLHAGDHAVLHERIHATRIFDAQIGLDIQITNLAAEVRRKSRGVDPRHGTYPAAARQDARPRGLHLIPHGRDDSETRNHDASFAQQRLLRGTIFRLWTCAN